MGRENYFLVLIALCAVQCIEAKKQLVYNYTGNVNVWNRASDDGFATWTISGDLTIQHLENHQIFRLDNLKTTIFNGLRTTTKPEEKEPLVNTDYITFPFRVYYNSIDDVEISVIENEPVWSANMKRAIASVFHVNSSAEDGFSGVEGTIFGNCNVSYETDTTDEKSRFITKTIDQNNCQGYSISNWINVEKADLNNNHSPNQFESVRVYAFQKNTGNLYSIQASSNYTYQNMPTVRSIHQVQQLQTFQLINAVEEFQPFTISTATEKVSILWDRSDESEETTKSQTEILAEYRNAVKVFRQEFEKRPLENRDIRSANRIDVLYSALSNLNVKGMALVTIEHGMAGDAADQHILLSLLPYIGTEPSTSLIKEFVKTDDINDLLLIKLLATFPTYVNGPSQEMIEKFKFLLYVRPTNIQVRYAGLLSYATLISDTYERGNIDEKFMHNIIEKYYKRLLRSEEYEEQLTYILGLINMANCMKEELMIQIVTNHEINDHLRTLATFGFKNHLADPTEEDVFSQIWPVVQNASENFEVRAAALDLLLSSNLKEEQFNTIVNTYDRKPENPYDEHLSNYVFTSLQALENSTGYSHYLADFATARLQQGNIPRYTRSWTTGNYRLAWSDSQANFGASLQTRLIATPVTNTFNIIHLSYDRFEMSFTLESYSVYLRLGGFVDTVFLGAFLRARDDSDSPIQALVDLIEKCKYNLKMGENINVDLALFSKRRAVFGIHLSQENIDTYSDNPLFLDLLKLLVYYQSISYPLINYSKFPSDLGTAIEISNEIEQVFYNEIDNFEQLFDDNVEYQELVYHYKLTNAYSSAIHVFNPLINASAVVYKHQSDETALDFPFKIRNSTNYVISWEPRNDTFNWACDRLIGTVVFEEEILKHYCSECQQYYEVPVGTPTVSQKSIFGMTFEATKTDTSHEQIRLNEMDPPRNEEIETIYSAHLVNAFAFPPAKPFMLLWHYFASKNANKDLDRTLLRTLPAFNEAYETFLELYIDGDTINKDIDPFDGAELEILMSYTNQRPDGEILMGLNGTFKMLSTTKTVDQVSKPQVEHNYAAYINYVDNTTYTKVAFNRDLLYPSKRSDKLSLKPVKPAKGKITLAYGEVESFADSPDQYMKFTEIYTASEVQNRRAEELPEYKKCQQDSVGLKYVPPTEECVVAHDALSRYDVYGLFVDFQHAGAMWERLIPYMDNTKYGYSVFEYNHLENGLVNISVSEEIRARYLPIPESNYQENSQFHDFLSSDPTAVAYDDYDIQAGLSTTCVITPNMIQTFTGVREPAFEQNAQQELVAFVECINETRAGLTVQRINNKAVGFKLWSGNNVFTASIENGKMKVHLNEEAISQNPETQDEQLKVYFLEDDVIYVVDNIVEVYYTTEYISIKALSIYNNYICGKCSYNN